MQQLKKLPNAQGENFLKLIEVINHQFSEKPDSRVIIFLPQRLYCQIAVEVIEQYTRKKAGLMASANFSTEVGGLNPVQQEENLRKFATGEYQILFTTSISDEGLDIPKCNLVIKYDFVTSNWMKSIMKKPDRLQIISPMSNEKAELEIWLAGVY